MSSNANTQKYLRVGVFWGDVLYDSNLFSAPSAVRVGKGKKHDFVFDVSRKFRSGTWQLAKLQKQSALVNFREDQKGFVHTKNEVFPIRMLIEREHLVPDGDGSYHLSLKMDERIDLEIDHMTFQIDWIDSTPPLSRRRPESRKETIWGFALTFTCILFCFLISRFETPVLESRVPERVVELIPLTPSQIVPPSPSVTAVAPTEEKLPAHEPDKPLNSIVKTTLPRPKPGAKKATSVPAPSPNASNEDLSDLASSLTSVDTRKVEVRSPTRSGRTAGSGISNLDSLSSKSLENVAQTDRVAQTEGQGNDSFRGTEGLRTTQSLNQGGNGSANPDRGLSREVIESTIRLRERKIRTCYEQQLAFSPQMHGTLQFRFTISPNGRASQISLMQDELSNQKVTHCVQAEIRSLKFPNPAGGVAVSVEYPFNFEPQN